MRLFIAVTLPEPLKLAIHRATEPLRNAAPTIRWVSADQLHITLKFLGEVKEPAVPAIGAALEGTADSHAPFDLDFAGIGAFPNTRRPRVYWLGVHPNSALHGLQETVETGIGPLGFPREARPFHPHLTLGRVGTEVPAGELRAAERLAGQLDYNGKLVVNSAELMQSRLSPKGARYEVLLSARLKGGN